MLTGTVTNSVISDITAQSMITQVGMTEYSVIIIIGLNLLLLTKEILSSSDRWNNSLNCSLNITILPLLVAFLAMVVYKISEIV